MSQYYRESFRFPPIRMFLDSENATNSLSRGDCMFCLNQPISLPNNVVCYVALNEMVIANMELNISSTNNLLYFQDITLTNGDVYVVTIPVGNYTATLLASALTAAFKISEKYDDIDILDTHVSVEFVQLTGQFKFSSTVFTAHDDQFKFKIKSGDGTITCPNNMIKVLFFEEVEVERTVILNG